MKFAVLALLGLTNAMKLSTEESTCPTCPGIPDGRDMGQYFPESCRMGEGGWVFCRINGHDYRMPGSSYDEPKAPKSK